MVLRGISWGWDGSLGKRGKKRLGKWVTARSWGSLGGVPVDGEGGRWMVFLSSQRLVAGPSIKFFLRNPLVATSVLTSPHAP